MLRCIIALTALLAAGVSLSGCSSSPVEGAWMLEYRELPNGEIIEPPAVQGHMTFRKGVRTMSLHWTAPEGEHSIAAVAIYDLAEFEYAERNLYWAYTVSDVESVFDRFDHVASSEVVYTERGRRFQLPLHNEPMLEVGDDRMTATMPDMWTDHWVRVEVAEDTSATDVAAPGRLESVIPPPAPEPEPATPDATDAEEAADEATANAEAAEEPAK